MHENEINNDIGFLGAFFGPLISSLNWSEMPFNGQILRSEKVFQIVKDLKPTYMIETGTYLGATSQYLASISESKLFTIEKNQEYANLAAQKFHINNFSDKIELHVADSASELPEILEGIGFGTSSIFVYLDAHWDDELPLRDEIRALNLWEGPCVVLIDDFQVPKFPNYGFDLYGNSAVCLEYIASDHQFEIWVPSIPHYFETGARRGSAYLINMKAKDLISTSFFVNLERIH